MEEFPLVFRFEILRVDSTPPDLQFGIFIGLIWGLLQLGQIIEAIPLSSRAWHLLAWGFSTSYGPDLLLHWSSVSIRPLEVCGLLL